MEASEKAIATKPKSFVIRVFGIFASLIGVPYLIQARDMLIAGLPASSLFIPPLQLAILTLDFVLGMSAIIIAMGLFLHKEWARQTWLTYLLLLLFVHFNMTVIYLLAGRRAALNRWIVVVVFVTVVSWAFLSKASIKARFH